jgi:predicted CopG family antitoxin
MNRTIAVSEEAYRKLDQLASREGETISEWLETMVAHVKLRTAETPPDHEPEVTEAFTPVIGEDEGRPPLTMYDLMKDHIGKVAGNGPRDLAENHSRYFLEGLLEKKRQGRL